MDYVIYRDYIVNRRFFIFCSLATCPLMVEREGGIDGVDGTEKVDIAKAISLTTAETSIAVLLDYDRGLKRENIS